MSIDYKTYLDEIINAVADPIFVKDKDHRWVLLNDAYCDFMGYKREELIGKTDYDFFPKEEAKTFWNKDEEVFKTKKENVNEEFFTDSKGIKHVIVTKKVLCCKAGADEQFIVGIIRDITERKKIEDALCDKMQQLATFNKSAVNRELKMVELKEKIKKLEAELKRKSK